MPQSSLVESNREERTVLSRGAVVGGEAHRGFCGSIRSRRAGRSSRNSDSPGHRETSQRLRQWARFSRDIHQKPHMVPNRTAGWGIYLCFN
ncbi:hypothetical protein MHYP_G00207310 [Metynnis hypsauchen]